MEIFHESKHFPKEEQFSLTDQIRELPEALLRTSVRATEKKRYPKMFVSKMVDADGEAAETQVWLEFAECCGYLSRKRETELRMGYEEVGRMLGGMIAHPERFS